jgi:hypothetical protein
LRVQGSLPSHPKPISVFLCRHLGLERNTESGTCRRLRWRWPGAERCNRSHSVFVRVDDHQACPLPGRQYSPSGSVRRPEGQTTAFGPPRGTALDGAKPGRQIDAVGGLGLLILPQVWAPRSQAAAHWRVRKIGRFTLSRPIPSVAAGAGLLQQVKHRDSPTAW